MTPVEDRKRMRLRYAGRCRACDTEIDRGVLAIYEKVTKTVLCLACDTSPAAPEVVPDSLPDDEPVVVEGQAGASARREHARRAANRESRIRSKYPRIGGLVLALTEQPQSTTAWERGAVGEELLGRRLDSLASPLVRVLHDRRIPRTKANIDHFVVCPSGVLVIDAKHYKGRPTLKIEGGILRPRVEHLLVGRRDCTKLVDGVLKQVALVVSALAAAPPSDTVRDDGRSAPIPVTGMLCFVNADWPLIGGAFTTRDVLVMWPKKAAALITQPGPLDAPEVDRVTRAIAAAFPPA